MAFSASWTAAFLLASWADLVLNSEVETTTEQYGDSDQTPATNGCDEGRVGLAGRGDVVSVGHDDLH
jgi:hypothetical protein